MWPNYIQGIVEGQQLWICVDTCAGEWQPLHKKRYWIRSTAGHEVVRCSRHLGQPLIQLGENKLQSS